MRGNEAGRLDLVILELERAWLHRRQHDGRKAEAIRQATGLDELAYYQRLRVLLTDESAWRQAPTVMRAVQRRMERATRQQGRVT